MRNIRQTLIYLTVATLLFLSFFSYFQFLEFKKYTKYVEHTYQVINALERQESSIAKLMALRRGYVISPTVALKDLIIATHAEVTASLDSLQVLVSDNDFQERNLKEVRQQINQQVFFSEEWFLVPFDVVMLDSMKDDIRVAMPVLDKVFRDLDDMKEVEQQLLKTRSFIQQDSGETVPQVLLITGITAISMLVYAFYLLSIELGERMKAKEALEKNISHLNLANEELERFAFIASHNLKEPLRKSRTFISRILPDVPADSVLLSNLQKMETSMERLQNMLDDLLIYTKIQHHNEIKELVDPGKLINNLVAAFKNEMEAANAEISMENVPKIEGFPTQITLLFHHLLSNSLKYRYPDQKTLIQVTSSINETTGHQVIVFSDNGIGMDTSYHQKIFEVFGRLHSKDQFEGTGIGLAICRRVMTNHNGHIAVDSSPGKGCSFSLYFPV